MHTSRFISLSITITTCIYILASLGYNVKSPPCTGRLKQQTFISHCSGGWESKIMVPHCQVLDEYPLLGLQTVIFLWWPHTVERGLASSLASAYEGTDPTHDSSTLMTSSHPKSPTSKYHHIGIRVFLYELGEGWTQTFSLLPSINLHLAIKSHVLIFIPSIPSHSHRIQFILPPFNISSSLHQ